MYENMRLSNYLAEFSEKILIFLHIHEMKYEIFWCFSTSSRNIDVHKNLRSRPPTAKVFLIFFFVVQVKRQGL